MTPRMSEGGGSPRPPVVVGSTSSATDSKPIDESHLATPPPSGELPPRFSDINDKLADHNMLEETAPERAGKGGESSGADADSKSDLPTIADATTDDLTTPTNTSTPALLSHASPDPTSEGASTFAHLPKDAIPADFLDSALQAFNPDDPAPEAAYPSPASTLRPPPTTEGETSLADKLDERIARTKEQRSTTKPLRVDTSAPNPSNSESSLPTPTSPAVPPRPSSRPSSRPPSVSRRQSEYRTRSPSSANNPTFSPPPIDPKRLSVSSSTNGSLHSPRLQSSDVGTVGGGEHFAMPPSPLGPSRRNSSQNTVPPADSNRKEEKEKETETKAVQPWEVPVVVRDWAYPESDPRHLGNLHPDLVASSSSEEDEEGTTYGRGFGRFRSSGTTGGGSKRKSGQAGKRRSSRWKREQAEEEERRQGLGLGSPIGDRHNSLLGIGGSDAGGGPSPSSTSSFSWGFVTSHSTDFPNSSPASSSVDGDDDERNGPSGYSFHDADHFGDTFYSNGRHESEIEEELGLGEFVPGVYQAVYEFEPELETEMRLSVGEWVSVFERQCAGWVQAGRIVDGVLTEEVGLVPENYLHRLDFEEGEGELIDPEKEDERKADVDGHEWKSVTDENTDVSVRRKEAATDAEEST